MRKAVVIWRDKERRKYRVAMGRNQKTHIGRYNTEKEAVAAARACEKAYRIGFEHGKNDTTTCKEMFPVGSKVTFMDPPVWHGLISEGFVLCHHKDTSVKVKDLDGTIYDNVPPEKIWPSSDEAEYQDI